MINKVTLIGNLGGDPEIRHLENGTAVGRFSLATNENYKDKEGNWQKQTEWHNIVVWRELAERAEKQLKKGMLVYVEGKISYRKYTDKDGHERTTTDIVAALFRTLEKLEGMTENRFPAAEVGYTGNSSKAAEHATAPVGVEDAPPPAEGDDLPF
ncbi:MAG: single-stranded DNA-binding protein [Saprospiraceae bacterium]|nr:single-stranded DNA-binding protein [Saprospiraceae bacterium]